MRLSYSNGKWFLTTPGYITNMRSRGLSSAGTSYDVFNSWHAAAKHIWYVLADYRKAYAEENQSLVRMLITKSQG